MARSNSKKTTEEEDEDSYEEASHSSKSTEKGTRAKASKSSDPSKSSKSSKSGADTPSAGASKTTKQKQADATATALELFNAYDKNPTLNPATEADYTALVKSWTPEISSVLGYDSLTERQNDVLWLNLHFWGQFKVPPKWSLAATKIATEAYAKGHLSLPDALVLGGLFDVEGQSVVGWPDRLARISKSLSPELYQEVKRRHSIPSIDFVKDIGTFKAFQEHTALQKRLAGKYDANVVLSLKQYREQNRPKELDPASIKADLQAPTMEEILGIGGEDDGDDGMEPEEEDDDKTEPKEEDGDRTEPEEDDVEM